MAGKVRHVWDLNHQVSQNDSSEEGTEHGIHRGISNASELHLKSSGYSENCT